MAHVWDRDLLAAIVVEGEEALRYVRERKIKPEYLGKPYDRGLELIEHYWTEHSAVISREALQHLINDSLPMIPADNIAVTADRIINRTKALMFRTALQKISPHLKEDGQAEEGFKLLRDSLAEIAGSFVQVVDETIDFAENAPKRLERYNETRDGTYSPGVSTPWPSLDALTNGFPKGQVSVILGGLSVGKTMLTVALLKHYFQLAVKTLLVSMEATKHQITTRLDGMLAQLDSREIAGGRLGIFQEPRYVAHIQKMRSLVGRAFIAATDRIKTVSDLDDEVKAIRPSVVLVDAMYFLRGKGDKSHERHADVVQELKGMARRHDLPTIVTSQISREGVKQKDGGGLTEAAFAFRIVQDSPLVIAVKEEDQLVYAGCPLRRVEVLKNTDGPIGKFVIRWDCERTMDFGEFQEELEEPEDWDGMQSLGFD